MSCTRDCVYKDEFVDDFVNYARVVSKILSPKLSIGLLSMSPGAARFWGIMPVYLLQDVLVTGPKVLGMIVAAIPGLLAITSLLLMVLP